MTCGARGGTHIEFTITAIAPETYVIQTVAADITFLRNTWNDKVDNDTLRRSSTILRMFLVDGMLQKAWKLAGFQREPIIIAPRIESLLETTDGHLIRFGISGGGCYEGVYAALAILQEGAGPAVEPVDGTNPVEFKFGLREFIESCGLMIDEHKVKRRQVVKYVSNKLGGGHLDIKRSPTEEDGVFILLDTHFDTFRFEDKNAVYFELLSIGQLIANPPDIRDFTEKVRS